MDSHSGSEAYVVKVDVREEACPPHGALFIMLAGNASIGCGAQLSE